MLSSDIIKKQSANHAMWEVVYGKLIRDQDAGREILLSCGNSTNPDDQAVIRSALKSISMDSKSINGNPSWGLELLADIFVDSKFEDILQSDVLKLNLLTSSPT